MNISKEIDISIKTVTLQAGEHRDINQPGRYFLLVSNSLAASTDLQVGIGNAALQSWPVLYSARIEKENDFFEKVRLHNPSGSAMTVKYIISTVPIDNNSAEVTGSITIPISDISDGTETPASILVHPLAGFLIDNAAAVNVGGGVVGIPVTGQQFETGDNITISNTTNYDGTYTVLASSTANQVNITAAYVAETFDGVDDTIALTNPRSIAADATRKELHICNHDTDYKVFWGDSNVDAANHRGVIIQPESVYILTCTDAIYLDCEAGAGAAGCRVSWASKTKT